jgi:protein TonB
MTRFRMASVGASVSLWSALAFIAATHNITGIIDHITLERPVITVTPKTDPPPPPPIKELKPIVRPVIAPMANIEPVVTSTIPVTAPYEAPPAPTEITNANWLQRPGAREFDRYYPTRATEREKEGRVVLNCTVNANGTINCTVASETPDGWGFGDAAVQISKAFKMAPQTINGAPTSGGTVRVPITFKLGG